ncbi:PIN domain-containing protein [Dactylosporangium sp. NPDC049742]|uniref:PIN-like domain-containing protein n=1 Tax=Dactylosporangium sp. NPDC049742 TaxID=3154737 RepID=UPI003420D7BD
MAMANFSDGFLPYLPPDKSRTSVALKTGIVVVDANVLLDAYRYTTDARSELLSALRALGKRLWVPHQVSLEFHRNRVSVIAAHGDAYRDAVKAISEFRKNYEDELVQHLRQFANRVALDEKTQNDLITSATKSLGELANRINLLQSRHGISDHFVRDDPVLEQLRELLAELVGEPMAPDVESEARAEAQKRVQEGRAPGFKDSSKSDPCGDYLLWRQSLEEARIRKVPLVLVTRDSKEDWFLKIRGKTIGALPELVQESLDYAGVDFIALTTRSFLVHARSELNASISQETLAQTEAIDQSARSRSNLVRFTMQTVDEALNRLEARQLDLANLEASVTHQLREGALLPDSDNEQDMADRAVLAHRLDAVKAERNFAEKLSTKLRNIKGAGSRIVFDPRELDYLQDHAAQAVISRPAPSHRTIADLFRDYRSNGARTLSGMTTSELRRIYATLSPDSNVHSSKTTKMDLIHLIASILEANADLDESLYPE